MSNSEISTETLHRLRQFAAQQDMSVDTFVNHLLDDQKIPFEMILDHLQDVVVLFDTQDHFVYANKAIEWVLEPYGLTRPQILGKTPKELGFPEDAIAFGENDVKHVMTTRKSHSSVFKTTTERGIIALETHLIPVFDAHEEILYLLSVSHNISKRTKMEEALRQSEANYRLLFKEAPIAIWKRDFSDIKAYLEALRASGIEDIETYLRAHPEEIAKCLMTVKTLDANHTALQMYHAKSVDEINTGFMKVVNTGEPQPASLAAVANNKTSFSGEFINKTMDGKELYLLMKWIVLPGHEVTYDEALVVTIDITEQKRYQASLVEQERLITRFRKEQEHNMLIQRSMSALSHDLRTPLSVIAISKDLLLYHFDKLTEEKRKEKLESIGKQLEFALELLDDTISMVRGTLSERAFKPSLISLDQLCQVSVEEVGASYGARDQLQFENLADVTTAYVDEILLSRILLNLLSNAIKYSPNKTPITLQLDRQAEKFILRVIDRGIGIPPEHLPHIFEPFYRAPDVKAINGTGLGLSIVKDCVTRHGGEIDITSELGIGTTVTICLPIQYPPASPIIP
mgnify:CR=1 FL=1